MLLILYNGQKDDYKAAEEFLSIRKDKTTRTKAAIKQRFSKIRQDLGKEFSGITDAQIEGRGANAYRFLSPIWLKNGEFHLCVQFKEHFSEVRVGVSANLIRFSLTKANVEVPNGIEIIEQNSQVFVSSKIPPDLVYVENVDTDIKVSNSVKKICSRNSAPRKAC